MEIIEEMSVDLFLCYVIIYIHLPGNPRYLYTLVLWAYLMESGELIKRNNKLLIVLLLIERLVLVVGWVLYISFDKEVGVW
jgi:hypothetical protein